MFREMRRKNQQLPEAEAVAILEEGSSGVLALLGEDGWPYAVPLNYVWHEGRIYFHWARSGKKLDALRNEARASFCVIGADQIAPEQYTSLYQSVIVFGKLRLLEDPSEKRAALERLAVKYSPREPEESRRAEIAKGFDAVLMVELTAEHLTGKEGRLLALRRGEVDQQTQTPRDN